MSTSRMILSAVASVISLSSCAHSAPTDKPEPTEPARPSHERVEKLTEPRRPKKNQPGMPRVDRRTTPDARVKAYPDIGEKPKVSISAVEFIQFAEGSARLNRAARRALDKMAEMIRSGPGGGVVRVEGHCDRKETQKAVLSLKRARVVRRYLVGKGVPGERLKAIGLGSTRPLATGRSAADRQQNRRVDFTFKEQAF